MLTRDQQDSLRDDPMVAVVAKVLKTLVGIGEEDWNVAIVAAALASATDNCLHTDDLGQILRWSNGIRAQVCVLHFMLIGATEVGVVDGTVKFRMPNNSPEEMMRQLVRNGVATAK